MFFRAYLGWSLKHVAQNYLFIAISFYLFIAILCAKMSRVNKALMGYTRVSVSKLVRIKFVQIANH